MRRAVVVARPRAAARGVPRPEERAPSPTPRAGEPGNGLNVLLITIDTLRADHLGAYGYQRKTSPHIDALARDGDACSSRPTPTGRRRAAASWP